ncbi:SusC/RagA family TonB-linked outer membrane protein [Limibacterium fermenti]|jgi:TonB-linked SusC/RagA family outer membrane protein|uniref:SusC/RagA family TonB-linked outer membrane protein n=1 Tax=Limibacterium fermenti TaxID=3229863 RepID=UPI000E95C277|nr:TonB-dependent receptor [Porphyromonadaceae bacterium]HBX46744.1 TonB-dependent receptor [Porphyromonadaceae bacterium]HCM19791.1 TonB-dependent receptor [Porphyromonadaceae bacterium]
MKRKLVLFLTLFFVGIGLATAQTRVQGMVVDEAGEPVIGATVTVKGSSQGTVTDIDGNFTISAPANGTLVVSYVGYVPQEVGVSENVRVTLVEDSELLDEVMVVAYGTTKRSSFTGSASTINNKTIKDIPVVSFEQALQGAASGVTISSSSGQPGSQQRISIRGVGSINASTEPLYVVDGIPMSPENISISGVTDSPGSLGISSIINPSDIASITVLKDAAAASLYGSRAANGVILIATKSGIAQKGKTRVTFKAQAGFNDWAVKSREIVSGDELRELWTESYYNYINDAVGDNWTEEQIWEEVNGTIDYYAAKPENGQYSDWEKALFKKGSSQLYEINLAGGNDKTHFFVSAAYNKTQGMVKTSNSQQYTGRVNLSHDVNDRFKIGTNLSVSKVGQERVMEGTAYANPYYATRTYLWPTIPIYNEDGSYYNGELLSGYENLVQSANTDKYPQSVFDSRSSIWGEYLIVDNLKFKQTLNYSRTTNDATTVWPFSGGNGEGMNGLTIKYSTGNEILYSSSLLTYDKVIGSHDFDILVGWDVERRDYKELQAVGQGFASDKISDLSSAAIPTGAYSITQPDRMLSLFSRLNYSYADKYYASASFRRDGSSRLGENNKWGNFWSLSGAWRLSEESFIKDNLSAIDNLRLRLSYGESGTLPSSWYGSQNTYALSGSYSKNPVMYPARIPNPDLSWEKSKTLNFGLDVRLWDAFTFEMDLYDKKTSDLIASIPVSQATGFSSYLSNEAEMSNRGIEFSIGYDVFKSKEPSGFFWNTQINFAHNVNKVNKIYGGKDNTSRSPFITREGEAYYSFYSREYAGYDPETGEEQWYTNKQLEDGSFEKEITKNPGQANRVIVGKADPKLTGGWLNTFSFKGFSLSAQMAFSWGGNFYDNSGWPAMSNGRFDFTYLPSKGQLDRWQKPGDSDKAYGRRSYGYAYGNYGSSKWLFDASYLRLKNLSLSYSLPATVINKIDLSSARLIVSSTNLFTISKTDDYDPESAYNGIVGFALPPLKDVTFGIEISF